jgi:hypothetical protein
MRCAFSAAVMPDDGAIPAAVAMAVFVKAVGQSAQGVGSDERLCQAGCMLPAIGRGLPGR